MKKMSVLIWLCGFSSLLSAVERPLLQLNRIDAQQQQRQKEQIQQQSERLRSDPDVRMEISSEKPTALPFNESPCYPIQHLSIVDYSSDNKTKPSQFQWALNKAVTQLNLQLPHCFGTQGLGILMKQVQNNVIERGYITTRVVAGEQNLTQGVFSLTVIPGQVRHTIIADVSSLPWFSKLTAKTALAFKQGDLVNIRDIEQSLENLKRVPTADANIDILPADNSSAFGESDIKITYQQRFPFRFSLNLDDSGSTSTGKWQGSATLSWDNLFSANDLFYTTFTHSLKHHSDNSGRRATRNYGFYYSIPFGYWTLSASLYKTDYHQDVFGAFDNTYLYAGRSETTNLNLAYRLYRDAVRKTTISGGFWSRHSKNYIDDAEIDVQRRRMAGWQINLSHIEYIKAVTLKLSLGFKWGTGVGRTIAAPEEYWRNGTSRPKIITASVDINYPFYMGKQPLAFNTNWSAQWNKTPLIQQDRLSIGGRYTVRGFDGELTLSGERGWLWRNELSWNIANKGHWVYLALDGGRVMGRSDGIRLGHHLMGTVLGLRGSWTHFYYDVFIGRPLSKPSGFRTSHTVTGFNIGLTF
ncbi:ShlB/FhaC/HecB family hemolysin secretion/activation protein [Histophilus somni]|uniref:ShlB/FhaC/HecB family hemolysin secretion/activation protein n=1 Tax=Histophilus somni TaxID=731 RepID=A0AAX2RXK6_HISSO|nr:ShlB/FhaC/HecB family hemolysin secretion/activation protein [Histophilus somni]QEH09332.1 ShlB/FhaC/HecB family hemolysin secretion/activation protein [Histophilus somni]QEH12012.1 ShlB/FhaC/HecB family hemolysin secretion/activation protein [Histophilus somni]QEH25607.1 ShlB/FhaC/HecB family hemolysin secretion/activation protein [Histophilus somni]QEH26491.1 ShlB/FhaC/HecB family hemolysin secretion/activation protein [Histophilus somni]QEH50684.1 ShlB/FhaC/HecB family hemolysin secretio